MRIGVNFFPKLNFCLELHVSLDNPFVTGDKYTSKDFRRLLTLMSSSINILSYDMTSNGLELFFFTCNWDVSLPINRLERISISELSRQFHLSL